MSTRSIRVLAIVAGISLFHGPAAAAPDDVPPPASPAPVAAPGDQPDLSRELADARRSLLEAEHELREANAALARASHGSDADGAELERASERRVEAQAAFDTARSRLPELMVRARAAGMSAAALRAYQHSLYGH
jgi:hypothetical protein